MRRRYLRWSVAAGVLIVVSTLGMPLSGQHTGSPDTLAALLVEVRGIRVAMEQLTSAGPRVQLALGRLQLQEQRVNTMLRRLDTVREERASAERDAADTRGQLTGLEEAIGQAQDPDERKALAVQSLALTAAIEEDSADVQRLRAEERRLSEAITVEQQRWAEINQQLEEMERALGR